jgi:hypothetical protein
MQRQSPTLTPTYSSPSPHRPSLRPHQSNHAPPPLARPTSSASQTSNPAPSNGCGKTGWPLEPWPCFPGDPGSGKTWVALAIAAALSRGRAPSTNHTLQLCTVLYASTANGAAELIRPCFANLDGDPARQYLLEGECSQYSVESAAQRDGVCIRTLRRAKFDLGVVSTKQSMSGAWHWALPENESAS